MKSIRAFEKGRKKSMKTKNSKKRPLLNDGDGLEILKKLYEKRINFYEAVSKKKISMDNLNTEEILKKIINFLDE